MKKKKLNIENLTIEKFAEVLDAEELKCVEGGANVSIDGYLLAGYPYHTPIASELDTNKYPPFADPFDTSGIVEQAAKKYSLSND